MKGMFVLEKVHFKDDSCVKGMVVLKKGDFKDGVCWCVV